MLARDNITFNNPIILVDTARTITSSQGNISLNDTIDGGQDLVLNALGGSVAINSVGVSTAPTLLDINALSANLNGTTITTAGEVQLEGVNTTRLATDVMIDSSDSSIQFGSLTGDQGLELVAGTGTITLADGSIDQLVITNSENIFFTNDFTTNRATNVTATNKIEMASSLQSEADITLLADNLDIDGLVRSNGPMTLTGTGTFTLDGEVNTEDGNVNINSSLTLDGNSIVTSGSGNVTFTNDVHGADHNLIVNADNGSVSFTSTVGGGEH